MENAQKPPLKILIATGGTAGHLFPAKELKKALEKETVLFAGYRLTSSAFFEQSLPFKEVSSSSSLKKWPKLIKGFFQAFFLQLKFRADVVVGFGSFHSFPVLLASLVLRRKIVLFEPNYTLGKVNRLFAPFAKAIAFQFPVAHKKAQYVPLLPWSQRGTGKKSYFQGEWKGVTLLVFGGSQGAKFFNETVPKAIALLPFPVRVIHLTGGQKSEVFYPCPNVVIEFEEDMESAYKAADIVVSRCGAGTSAELIRFCKPALLIPYPYAYDHQRKNGEFLRGGVKLLLQQEASIKKIAREIELLQKNLSSHRRVLQNIALPKSESLAKIIQGIARS